MQIVVDDLERRMMRYFSPHIVSQARRTTMNEDASRFLFSLRFNVFHIAAKLIDVLRRRLPLLAFDNNGSFIFVDKENV